MRRGNDLFRIALIAVAVLALIEIFLTGMKTPMSSGDDLALEVTPYFYIEKLHAEGRWLVYAWQRIVGITPRTFDFHLSLAAWCIASSFIAALLVSTRNLVVATVVALSLSASPSAINLLFYPHTAVPMELTLLAASIPLYLLRDRFGWWCLSLAAGVFFSMLSYPLFSFYLFGAGLLTQVAGTVSGRESISLALSLRRMCIIAAVSAAAVIAGTVSIYALNFWQFGHFGVQVEPWRYLGIPDHGGGHLGLAIWNLSQCLAYLAEQTLLLPVVALVLLGTWLSGMYDKARDSGIRRNWRVSAVEIALLLIAGLAPFVIPLLHGTPLPYDRGGITLYLACVGLGVISMQATVSRKAIACAALFVLAIAGIATQIREFRVQAVQDAVNHNIMETIGRDLQQLAPDLKGKEIEITFLGEMENLDGLARGEYWWAVWLLRSDLRDWQLKRVSNCINTDELEPNAMDGLVNWTATAPSFPAQGYMLARGRQVFIKMDRVTTPPKGC